MKKKLLTYIKTMFVTAGLVALPLTAVAPVSAIDVFKAGCAGNSTGVCGADAQGDDFLKLMKNIISTLLLVLGIIAVIMIIIGGIRYTTSNGDSNQIKAAKDTVLYAVIGLIVAIMSYAIVQFVLASVKK
jgi:hypothetical protein